MGLDLGRVEKGLHDHAVLFGFFAERAELIGRCGGGDHVEAKLDVLEADGDVTREAESTAKIETTRDRDFDTFGGDAHGCGNHLASDLRASGKSAEEKITGTRAGACAADSGVRLGFVDGAANVDGAGDGRACGLSAFRGESDFGRGWFSAISVFERFLDGLKIHGGLQSWAMAAGR